MATKTVAGVVWTGRKGGWYRGARWALERDEADGAVWSWMLTDSALPENDPHRTVRFPSMRKASSYVWTRERNAQHWAPGGTIGVRS